MSDVVPAAAVRVPAPFRAPTFSPPVARAVREFLEHEAHGNLRRFGVPTIAPHLRERAAAYLAEADRAAAPASPGAVAAWLAAVCGAVANPPTEDEYRVRAGAVAAACSDLPGWVFNAETATLAVRRFQWFPSAAEVYALLGEATKAHRDTVRALRAIAAAPPPDEPGEPVDRAAAAEVVAQLAGEMSARAEARESAAGGGAAAPAPRARPLPPEHLAAARAAAGIPVRMGAPDAGA